MKLAVRKEPGHVPMSGYHYLMMPMKVECDEQAAIFELMGHIIIEVDDERGERLIKNAKAALSHQVEVAILTDKAEREQIKPIPSPSI